MKKILIILIFLSITSQTFAIFTNADLIAAKFLSKRGIIEEAYYNFDNYNLEGSISRREMLKVIINLSGTAVPDTCVGTFLDLPSSDWGCKYAEEALARGYISSTMYFRPDDDLTKIEALKLIMKAKNIPKTNHTDWRVGYTQGGDNAGIIEGVFVDYNTLAVRGWIFQVAQASIDDNFLDVEMREKIIIGPPPVTGYSLEERLVMQAAIIRDIGNNFEIRQTHYYTYLYHDGQEIWSWLHSEMGSDLTWRSDDVSDLNCGDTITGLTVTHPTTEEYAQLWNLLPQEQQINCVRQELYHSFITSSSSNTDLIFVKMFDNTIVLQYMYDPVNERMYHIPFMQDGLKVKRNSDGIFIKYSGVNYGAGGFLFLSNQGKVRELYFRTSVGSNSIVGVFSDFELLANGQIKLILVISAITAPLLTKDVIIDITHAPKK